MKKNIALMMALLVAGAAMAANPKTRKNSRTEMGIHGNAIYVIEYTYNLHSGRDGGRQLICIDSITFDKRGNFADKFRTKANEYTWYSYFFDVNGYSLGWNEYNREKMLTGRTAYLNDQDGNRVERTVYLGNQMTKKESSKYVGGLMMEEQSFDQDGQMTELRKYKYDQKGNYKATFMTLLPANFMTYICACFILVAQKEGFGSIIPQSTGYILAGVITVVGGSIAPFWLKIYKRNKIK